MCFSSLVIIVKGVGLAKIYKDSFLTKRKENMVIYDVG